MRKSWAAAVACAIVLLMAAPAVGQQQGLGAAVSITGPTEGTVAVDTDATFAFQVTNDGASGGPLDEQNRADIDMEVEGVPEGWTVSMAPDPFELRPGESQNVTLTISVRPGSEATAAELTVRATLTTRAEDLDPILGQIPGQSQSASADTTLALTRDDSAARNALEFVGGTGLIVIVLALLAAILLSTRLIIESRRVTVALHSAERTGATKAGGRCALEVEVRNIGKSDDTVVFQVGQVGDGWAAFLPVPELELARGAKETLHLVVIAPQDAEPGDRQEVLVTAHSAQGPKHPASITFEVVVK